jgi:hypothetical protein
MTMMADTNHDSNGSNTPPLQPDKVLEVEALEELLREEALRHIEAAWRAQRRLMQACLKPDKPDEKKDDEVEEASPSERESEEDSDDEDEVSIVAIKPAPSRRGF